MLTTGKVAEAFEIQREPDRTRDRYGRHMFGQSLLLSRRLVQAGVPVVQANMGRVQNWDSHGNIFPRLKNDLLPPLDQGVAALLDDLEALGMLEETLVLVTGEFGRTPKIGRDSASGNGKPGRDHWPKAFTGVFAGWRVRRPGDRQDGQDWLLIPRRRPLRQTMWARRSITRWGWIGTRIFQINSAGRCGSTAVGPLRRSIRRSMGAASIQFRGAAHALALLRRATTVVAAPASVEERLPTEAAKCRR